MRMLVASMLLVACGKTTPNVDAGAPPPPPPPVVTGPRKVTLVPAQAIASESISIRVHAETPEPLPAPISIDVMLVLPNGSTRSVTTSLRQEKVCMPIDPVTPEDLKQGPYCQPGPIQDGNAFFPGPAASGRYVATASGKPPIDVAPLAFDIAGAAKSGDR